MSAAQQAILIAGFSGRALAASARRAGFLPLVVDGFGDSDTRAIAGEVDVDSEAVANGFTAARLFPALDALARLSPLPIAGLVLGAGFEDTPLLVASLASRYTLLGCPASSVAAAKDPKRFFGLLTEIGIAHPETRVSAPADGTGWLSKRIGGSGGNHIAVCGRSVSGHKDRYYQRRVTGPGISMLGVVKGRRAAFAFTRQWPSPMPRRPYRFGGVAGAIDLDADLEARLVDIGIDLSARLGLAGLVSFDFLLVGGVPNLIEVNPRPGASLDVLDDDGGTLFAAHVAACRGDDPVAILSRGWRPRPRAAAYLYADAGNLTIPDIDWPDWTSDRPAAGTHIPRYSPVATVHATGEFAEAAAKLADQRLGDLAVMLYPS
ncbi:MAG: ATP-grasp domain-containing protein [Hyphomicrobiaceae bacterium]|nr:ATP-grasp domain-containing protein [Hyphomicrobiaceae bacterium]